MRGSLAAKIGNEDLPLLHQAVDTPGGRWGCLAVPFGGGGDSLSLNFHSNCSFCLYGSAQGHLPWLALLAQLQISAASGGEPVLMISLEVLIYLQMEKYWHLS